MNKPANRGVYAIFGVLIGAGVTMFAQWTGDLLFRPPSNEPIRMEVIHQGQPVLDKKLEIKPPADANPGSDNGLVI